MKRWIPLSLILLLASCNKEVADPTSLAPATPYSSWTPKKGNSLVSSMHCKTILPPHFETAELTLADLIDISLQNNPSTKQTWSQARNAAAQFGQSLSVFFPTLKFAGTYYREKGAFLNPGVISDFYYTQAGPDLQLSYTLFDFGQSTAQALAAREALYYADFSHNQNIQYVVQSVMQDYYNYLYQMAALRANEANLENAQSSLDAANERFALGVAALGDVAQARTQYLQAKINLTTQKQQVENAFAQLSVDVGLPANIPFKVQPMPEQIQVDPMLQNIDFLVAQAQERRQDFHAAQAQVRSKEALLLNAKRASLPILTTNVDMGHYWFQQGLQENNIHWNFLVSLNFPIFQGFYYRNGVRKAQADVDYAKAQMLQKELSIIQDVTVAETSVKSAAQNLCDTQEYLKSAQLEFQIALSGYKAGTMTILDVLSAQSSLSDARAKKAGAQKDWFTALANVAYATGSLCTTPTEVATCELSP